MSRNIWFVRHGETDHNVNRIFQGHLDTPLNQRGVDQAAAVGERLKEVRFDGMYSSDLARAADTARSIAGHQSVELSLVPELREMNYGVLQDVPITDFQSVLQAHGQGELWGDGVFAAGEHIAPPGGESLTDLRNRLIHFVAMIEERHPLEADHSILIVAHGGTLKTLVTLFLGLPATARDIFGFDNCSVTRVDCYAGGSRLELYNAVYWWPLIEVTSPK